MNEKMRVVGAWSDFWAVAFLGTDRSPCSVGVTLFSEGYLGQNTKNEFVGHVRHGYHNEQCLVEILELSLWSTFDEDVARNLITSHMFLVPVFYKVVCNKQKTKLVIFEAYNAILDIRFLFATEGSLILVQSAQI